MFLKCNVVDPSQLRIAGLSVEYPDLFELGIRLRRKELPQVKTGNPMLAFRGGHCAIQVGGCGNTLRPRHEFNGQVQADNVRDHRAGMSDHPLQKHAQVRLRVHHIVIPRFLCRQVS